MKILQEAYRHPTQASEVRLNVYERPTGGYLVTEDRLGTATVVATLGLFDGREAALLRAHARARELERQRYRKVA
jgi:hypothetical protein